MRIPILTSLLCSTVLVAGLVASASAEELVTIDRVGAADAPNILTMRANPTQSPNSPSDAQRAVRHNGQRLELPATGASVEVAVGPGRHTVELGPE